MGLFVPELESRKLFSSLRIKDLSLLVNLGVTSEERSQRQEVLVSVEIRFSSPPTGIKSDTLNQTICYSDISDKIRGYCLGREFQLIEKLGGDIYQLLRETTRNEDLIFIQVHKVAPPVEGLRGGTIFGLGDFEKEIPV